MLAAVTRHLTPDTRERADRRATYTPHVPPNPTVTFPFSTITGTSRPPETRIIRSRSAWSAFTLMYRNGTFRFAYASRAAVVWGHVSLPKISTFGASILHLRTDRNAG